MTKTVLSIVAALVVTFAIGFVIGRWVSHANDAKSFTVITRESYETNSMVLRLLNEGDIESAKLIISGQIRTQQLMLARIDKE